MLQPTSSSDAQARITRLESQLREREALLNQQTVVLEAREQRIRMLEKALRVLRADKYGASREKLGVAPGQRGLFNEVEAVIELTEVTGVPPELTATPLRETRSSETKAGRKAFAAHLPRIEIRHELPESERICACGTALTEIGAAETSEQLDYIPAKVQVIRHVRPKYACACCQNGVRIAPVPAHILPRSNAAPGLLAHLVTAKYVDGLPLHRQETIFGAARQPRPRLNRNGALRRRRAPVLLGRRDQEALRAYARTHRPLRRDTAALSQFAVLARGLARAIRETPSACDGESSGTTVCRAVTM